MRRLIVLVPLLALAAARPETYREKEDFQYSRSSTDEGSKSGYYGAQRGNMGGNYERAHNMDGLAQHQMSGLVRQVQGELGDAANQRTGSVYTAANSKGIYGSGNYDLTNLEGRNFAEGVTFENSQSHSSLSSSRNRYNGNSYIPTGNYGTYDDYNSRYRGQSSAANSQQQVVYSNRHNSASNLQAAREYETRHQSQNSGHYSQTGYHGHHEYDQANLDASSGLNVNGRLVSTIPVKIVIRPGSRVAIPVATQQVDSTHSSSNFNENSISEADVLNSNDQNVVVKPASNSKHYESSYSYRKEWERHNALPTNVVPLSIPTVRPYVQNSELYEDADNVDHTSSKRQEISSSSLHKAHTSHSSINAKSSSATQFNQAADYDAHIYNGAASNIDSSAYGLNGHNDLSNLNNQVEDFGTKPKSYQSSYSYHKSWERQGDPYIIKPIPSVNSGNEQAQRFTKSSNAAYDSTRHYGTHARSQNRQYQYNEEDCDCDETGHVRVARSYNEEELGQQVQKQWDNLEDLGQQTQTHWDQIDVGQQTQNTWDNLEQNKRDRLEDLGQQVQNQWDRYDGTQQTENKWDKLEDMGQRSQTQWQDGSQQSINNWDRFVNEPQSQTDFGQQVQTQWFTPESAQKEDNSEVNPSLINTEQQVQNQWNLGTLQVEQQVDSVNSKEQKNYGFQQTEEGQSNTFDQQVQNNYGHSQESQMNIFDQQIQNHGGQSQINAFDQQVHNNYGQIEGQINTFDQQIQNHDGEFKEGPINTFDQKVQNNYGQSEESQKNTFDQQIQDHGGQFKEGQINTFDQQVQNNYGQSEEGQKNAFDQEVQNHDAHTEDSQISGFDQQVQNNDGFNMHGSWDKITNGDVLQSSKTDIQNTDLGQETVNSWSYNHHRINSDTFKFNEHHSAVSVNRHQSENKYINTRQQFHHNTQSNGQSELSNDGLSVVPLLSLWGKLDNIEKQTSQDAGVVQNVQKTDNKVNEFSDVVTHVVPVTPTTSAYTTTSTTTVKTPVLNKHHRDVGRGDIETEDSIVPEEVVNVKPHKTPEEIEALSMTKEINENEKNKHPDMETTTKSYRAALNNVHQVRQDTQDINTLLINQEQNDIHQGQFANQNILPNNEKRDQENSFNKYFFDFSHQNEILIQERLEKQLHNLENSGFTIEQQKNNDSNILSHWHHNRTNKHESPSEWQENVDVGQQVQTAWDHNKFEQALQSPWNHNDRTEQEQDSGFHHHDNLEQAIQSAWHLNDKVEQESQSTWQHNDKFEPELHSAWEESHKYEQEPHLTGDQSHKFEQELQSWHGSGNIEQVPHSDWEQNVHVPPYSFNQNGNIEHKPHTSWQTNIKLEQESQPWQQIGIVEQVPHSHQEQEKKVVFEPQSSLNHNSNIEHETHTSWQTNQKLEQDLQPIRHQSGNEYQHSEISLSNNLETQQQVVKEWKPFLLPNNANQQIEHSQSDNIGQQRIAQQLQTKPYDKEAELRNNPDVTYLEQVESKLNSEDLETPLEPVTTTKPGFWKSVGHKFVNAKDKVSSWFKG